MSLCSLIDRAGGTPFVLRRASVPACLLDQVPAGSQPDRDGVLLLDLLIVSGRIAAIEDGARNDMLETANGASRRAPPQTVAIDLDRRHVWPSLVDMHAHLDKGHIIDRARNADGTHPGARDATTRDRLAHWRQTDLLRRMRFGVRCAEAHGVAAIRTHLDSHPEQGPESWAAFRALRDECGSRIGLQAVALMPIDQYATPYADSLADIVAQSGGLLGGVTRKTGGRHEEGLADLDGLLDRLFTLARDRDLDIDLHVDESGDPEAASLPAVARATLRHGYEGRVVCGHCCSLSLQSPQHQDEQIALLARAGIAIVSLPTVNMYLQDRMAGRTPRWRGITPIHELLQGGVPVAVAGDNCRDPFYAYGDHDMLDTFRQAVRIGHLDHPFGSAPALAGPMPADIMHLPGVGRLSVGAPADMMILNARSFDQLIARPQSDRIVLRNGVRLTDGLPDYSELDAAD